MVSTSTKNPFAATHAGDTVKAQAQKHRSFGFNQFTNSEYSVLVLDREWRSRTASRWRGERGAGP